MNVIMSNVPKNLQWIDLIFKDFVDRSLELEGYGFGNIDQINSEVLEYPYLWVDPDRTRVIRNTSPKSGFSAMEVEIEVIVADKLRSDVTNEVETISDVNEIILSAITELSQHPYYVKNNVSLSRDIDIVNEWRRNDDIVNRAVARLTLRWPFSYTYCSQPVIYTGLTPSSFSCDPADISNSDFSYSNTIPSGGSLVLPDIDITNTDSDLIDTIPSVVNYTIQDVDWTDSDGSTYSTPYGQSIVATPCGAAEVQLIVYDNLVEFNPLTQSTWGDNVYLYPTATGFTPTEYTYYVPNESGYYDIFTSSTYFEWDIEAAGNYQLMVIASDGTNQAVGTYDFEAIGLPLDYVKSCISSALAFKPLLSSFTASIVNIRRSSDNASSDFTYDELIDGTALTFVGSGNIGFLTRIYDQSGNGREIFQTIAGWQGIIIESNDFVRDSAGNITYRNQNGTQAMRTYGHMKSSDNNLVMMGTEINAITSGFQGWLFTFAGNPAVGVYSNIPTATTPATTNTGFPDYYGNGNPIIDQRGPLGVHILGNLAITSIVNADYVGVAWRSNDAATILLYGDTSSKFSFMITSNNFDDTERALLEEKMNDLYGYY